MFIKTAFLLSSTLGFWEGRAFSGFGIFEVIHLAVKKILFLVDGPFIPQDMAYNHHHSPSFSVVFCIDLISLRGHCHFILLDISSFIRFFALSFRLNDFFQFSDIETPLNLEAVCYREKNSSALHVYVSVIEELFCTARQV